MFVRVHVRVLLQDHYKIGRPGQLYCTRQHFSLTAPFWPRRPGSSSAEASCTYPPSSPSLNSQHTTHPHKGSSRLTDQEPRHVKLEDQHPLHLPAIPLPPPAIINARQRRERALHPVDDTQELQPRRSRLGGEEAAEDPEGGGQLEGELEEGEEAEEARLEGVGGEEVEVLVGCCVEFAEGVEGVEGGGGGDPEGFGEEADEVDDWGL